MGRQKIFAPKCLAAPGSCRYFLRLEPGSAGNRARPLFSRRTLDAGRRSPRGICLFWGLGLCLAAANVATPTRTMKQRAPFHQFLPKCSLPRMYSSTSSGESLDTRGAPFHRPRTFSTGSSRDLLEPAPLLAKIFARLLPRDTHRTSPLLSVAIHLRSPSPAPLYRHIARPGLMNRYRNRGLGLADAIGGERRIDGGQVGARSCAGNWRRGRRRSASATAANKRAE